MASNSWAFCSGAHFSVAGLSEAWPFRSKSRARDSRRQSKARKRNAGAERECHQREKRSSASSPPAQGTLFWDALNCRCPPQPRCASSWEHGDEPCQLLALPWRGAVSVSQPHLSAASVRVFSTHRACVFNYTSQRADGQHLTEQGAEAVTLLVQGQGRAGS